MNPLLKKITMTVTAAFALACASGPIGVQVFRSQIAVERSARLSGETAMPSVAVVDRLRDERRLEEARAEAMHLLAGHPHETAVLWRAARSLADTALSNPDESVRGEAALEGLTLAREAAAIAPDDADCQAQLAFLLGITTHLQPMKERSQHAYATIAAAERALELNPDSALAHQTLGVVHLRLSTLPWIARTMAKDIPASSLEIAEQQMRLAVEIEPSQASHLYLAKVLLAEGRQQEAIAVLREATTLPNAFPRDLIHRAEIFKLLEEIA